MTGEDTARAGRIPEAEHAHPDDGRLTTGEGTDADEGEDAVEAEVQTAVANGIRPVSESERGDLGLRANDELTTGTPP